MNTGGDRPVEAAGGAFAPVLRRCRPLFPPELVGGGKFHLVRQGINHVKVVVERGARTEAKACVGMEVLPYG